jgi:hypothetical protein
MAHKRSSNRGDDTPPAKSTVEEKSFRRRYRAPISVLAVLLSTAGGAWIDSLFRPQVSHALPEHPPATPVAHDPTPFPAATRDAMAHERAFEGARGPWGRLSYERIAISMPDDYAPAQPSVEPIRWWFQNASREDVEGVFKQAGLTPDQLKILGQTKWETSPQGVIVSPPRPLVIDLAPAARARIYDVLSATPQNVAQQTPEVFRAEYLDERIESSGLDPATVGLFRNLLYPRRDRLLFSDMEALLGTLTDGADRKRLHEMVHRKATYMVHLQVDKTSDIDAMVAYWTYPGRPKGLRTLFESLARVPGGASLDITHLLPPFARQHLYTFPDPSPVDSIAQRHDCLWTSFNFFGDVPDERYVEPGYAGQVIARDYRQVTAPRFGDLVVLTDERQQSVHFAVYLADNLVFTKNGAHQMQPWMLQTLPDVVTFYSITRPKPLGVRYLRHKG